MKTCISLIMTCLLVLALLAGCTDAGNVSTTDDGRVNGGASSTESSSGILDDPNRGDAMTPSDNAGSGSVGGDSGMTGNGSTSGNGTTNGGTNGSSNGTNGGTGSANGSTGNGTTDGGSGMTGGSGSGITGGAGAQ